MTVSEFGGIDGKDVSERAESDDNETQGMWGEYVGRIEETYKCCREAVAGRKGDSCG